MKDNANTLTCATTCSSRLIFLNLRKASISIAMETYRGNVKTIAAIVSYFPFCLSINDYDRLFNNALSTLKLIPTNKTVLNHLLNLSASWPIFSN
jgi:hypothetical protein